MLLIPVQDQGNWRRPPVLMAALVLLNLIIHLHIETRVRSPETQLQHFLDESRIELLVQKEWTIFLDWLEGERSRQWLEFQDVKEEKRRRILERRAWPRKHFSEQVRAHWQQHAPSQQWREARRALEHWRSQQPFVRYGLIPDEPDAGSLLTHIFVHGGWMHLFGNMLFLLLFGVPMERHWGVARLALIYLLCGLGSALVSLLVNADSDTPTVGASGAISGLMGLYVASYGFRRIEFFYTLGFVFGSFRAPAFAILPLWVAMEVVQKFTLDTNVAYMAHVGGLLTGAAMAPLFSALWPVTTPRDLNEAGPARVTAQQAYRDDRIPASIENKARELEFDQALELARLRLDEHPDWPALRDYIAGLLPRASSRAQKTLIERAARQRHAGKLDHASLARLWQQASVDTSGLPPAVLVITAESLLHQRRVAEARTLVDQLLNKDINHPRVEQLRRWLAEAEQSSTR